MQKALPVLGLADGTHSYGLNGGIAGVIPAQEVPLAFTVLGMNVKKSEIEAAAEEYNADKPIVLP